MSDHEILSASSFDNRYNVTPIPDTTSETEIYFDSNTKILPNPKPSVKQSKPKKIPAGIYRQPKRSDSDESGSETLNFGRQHMNNLLGQKKTHKKHSTKQNVRSNTGKKNKRGDMGSDPSDDSDSSSTSDSDYIPIPNANPTPNANKNIIKTTTIISDKPCFRLTLIVPICG